MNQVDILNCNWLSERANRRIMLESSGNLELAHHEHCTFHSINNSGDFISVANGTAFSKFPQAGEVVYPNFWKFPSHLIFVLVEWFAFRKFDNFRKFPYDLSLVRSFWLYGERPITTSIANNYSFPRTIQHSFGQKIKFILHNVIFY